MGTQKGWLAWSQERGPWPPMGRGARLVQHSNHFFKMFLKNLLFLIYRGIRRACSNARGYAFMWQYTLTLTLIIHLLLDMEEVDVEPQGRLFVYCDLTYLVSLHFRWPSGGMPRYMLDGSLHNQLIHWFLLHVDGMAVDLRLVEVGEEGMLI